MRQHSIKVQLSSTRWWPRLLHTLTTDPRLWRILLVINLVGSAYGFYWYRDQLAATPISQWIWVPDSPGSTLLFALWLMALLAGRNGTRGWVGALAACAFIGNMKYGLWTATVLPEHAIWSHHWNPEDIYLSLSHLGMCVQGVLYAWRYRLKPWMVGLGMAWMFAQDSMDYWLLGTHPRLPDDALLGHAALAAVTYSVIWGLYLLWRAE